MAKRPPEPAGEHIAENMNWDAPDPEPTPEPEPQQRQDAIAQAQPIQPPAGNVT